VNYKISIQDCEGDDPKVYDEEVYGPIKPPYDPCALDGSLEHVSVGHVGNQLTVNQKWPNTVLYSCAQYSLFAELENCFESDKNYVSDQTLAFNDD
jgi:hypothetical protein